MTDEPIQAARKLSVIYAKLPTRHGLRKMRVDLYLPDAERPPLLIWFHSGGFRSGGIDHPAHNKMGQAFAHRKIATAFVEYRLKTPVASLSKQSQAILPDLMADVETNDFGLASILTGARALGAMENGVVFLNWLKQIGTRHGLKGPIMLGGSSAGAITVLNMLSLPAHMGIKMPSIHAAFSLSGGFAYPSFYTPNATRILAQHNPVDDKVGVASIQHYAALAGPNLTLIENDKQSHGDLKLYPQEPIQDAVDRMVSFACGRGVPAYKIP